MSYTYVVYLMTDITKINDFVSFFENFSRKSRQKQRKVEKNKEKGREKWLTPVCKNILCFILFLESETKDILKIPSNIYDKTFFFTKIVTQPEITCSKLTTETLEQGVKYVQS